MSLSILGIGTASPPRRIRQTDAARLAAGFANAEPGHERTLAAIYRQTRIRTRGSVVLEEPGDAPYLQTFFPPADTADDAGPSTGARMERYATEAGPLAVAAARRALERAATVAEDVTHLVTCSCTGFVTPGVDLELVEALGLSAGVARTHVGFMGCHGAFNALRVAEAFAASQDDALVLVVCVELCSLHLQYGNRSDLVVANSIFADGAGAVVGAGPAHPRGGAAGAWKLTRQWSRILPDSRDEMGWMIGDHGFEMNLSARVPTLVATALPQALAETLGGCGLATADVASWAVHPGGPRVLARVEEALALPPDALAVSQAVLAEHGNMSSATILFILEQLLEDATPPCVALAFGPGLTTEIALFDRGRASPR
jgi:predicted naringenin-chalcone synthase